MTLLVCFAGCKKDLAGSSQAGSQGTYLPTNQETKVHSNSQKPKPIPEANSGESTEKLCLTSEPTIASDQRKQELIASWNRLNERANKGLWYANHTNRGSMGPVLGNTQDTVMEAYLLMYEATGDCLYLERFITIADRVLSHRDDHAGYTDYTGESNPVWSTDHSAYVSTAGRHYGFLFESGNITYPISKFAYLVSQSEVLQSFMHASGRSYRSIADRYVIEVEQTLTYHFQRWHTDTVRVSGKIWNIGFYSSRADANQLTGILPGSVLPVNHQTSIARTIVMMWLVTRDRSYFDQATRMTNWLLLEMDYQPNGSYHWRYWPRMDYYSAGFVKNGGNQDAEDLGHATLTFVFAKLASDHIGVFYAVEIQRLAKTFSANLFPDEERYFGLVNGTLPIAATHSYLKDVGMFLPYFQNNQNVRTRIQQMILNVLKLDQGFESASGARSLASLIANW